MTTLADYIKQKRLEKTLDDGRPLSRSEMAKRAGFTPQYAMGIERGQVIPSEEVLERICDVLEADERTMFKLADKLPIRVIEQAKRDFYRED